ncbi:MAG: radical SAM protein [Candidatus Lokiarchaeota archaeon]|nr:radical SAM protein [Candidatus Lokiarchaeota archaeon]
MKISIDLNSEIGPFFNIEKDKMIVQLHDTLISYMTKNELKKLLSKKFNIYDLNLIFSLKNPEFNVILTSDYHLPEKTRILKYLKFILSRKIYDRLRNKYTKRKIYYITRNSNIPLIGSIYFALIDRVTNLLQIRPITGCLLNCPFCSVDEGPRSKTRMIDYIIEPNYIFDETNRIVDFKDCDDIEIHIDGQSEPLTYPYLIDLISRYSEMSEIKVISIQTNGLLLNEKRIENLRRAGLNRINLSINSLDKRQAKFLAGKKDYEIDKVIDLIDIILENNLEILIAPIIIPGINDNQIEPIIRLMLEKDIDNKWPIFGFQKYIPYQFGRKMSVKNESFDTFNKKLRNLEEKYGVKLLLSPEDFNIQKVKAPENPIKKKSIIKAKIVLPGRIYINENKKEMLGVAKNRLIHIINTNSRINEVKKIKIFRNKHNINYGKVI